MRAEPLGWVLHEGRRIPVDAQGVSIGRAEDCDVAAPVSPERLQVLVPA